LYANPDYLLSFEDDFKPIMDDTEFIGDEEYVE
jgi:hypothetical protein